MLLSLVLLGLALPAQAMFSPNHLLITTATGYYQLNIATGAIVNPVESTGDLAPCWLPNGNWLSAVGNIATERTFEGVVVNEYVLPANITGFTPGPDGSVIVGVKDAVYSLDLVSGLSRKILDLFGESLPCWLPKGDLLVLNETGLYVIDLPTGVILKEIPFQGGIGATVGSDGRVYVTTLTGISVFDLRGDKAPGFIPYPDDFTGAVGPVCLPNGRIGLVGAGVYFEVDPVTGEGFNLIELTGDVTGATMVGFRFRARLNGVLTERGVGSRLINERVTLTVLPGSRTSMMVFEGANAGVPANGVNDPIEPPNGMATLFGVPMLTFPGFDGFRDIRSRTREVIGSHVNRIMGSMALRLRGKIGGDICILFVVYKGQST